MLACGPEPMLEAVRALAPDAQLAWEAPMACGYGACYGCVVELDGALQAALRGRAGAVLLLNASGCLDALDGARHGAAARRLRDEDGHAGAARGEPAGADRRDRLRDAQLDRAREPGPRALPRRDAAALRGLGVPLWVSVGGFSASEYAETCARLEDVTIELNLSCPNVDEAPESAAEIVAACRAATDLPLYAKLSPAAWDIAEVARAVEAAGADGLSLVNTIRGLALDERLRPILARATGGYSGPALKPIALAAVYACRRAAQLPIVGMGGVRTGRDALELLACGATHVALGTVLFADPDAPARVRAELAEAVGAAGFERVEDAVGAAHEAVQYGLKLGKTMPVARGAEVVSTAALMVPPQTQVQAPVRSLDQRMEALKRANDIRVKRAQLKKDLKSGEVSIDDILRDPPEYVSTAKVFDMLMAVPKFGRVKAARLLNQCRISQSKTVGGLSDRQRQELIGLFNR